MPKVDERDQLQRQADQDTATKNAPAKTNNKVASMQDLLDGVCSAPNEWVGTRQLTADEARTIGSKANVILITGYMHKAVVAANAADINVRSIVSVSCGGPNKTTYVADWMTTYDPSRIAQFTKATGITTVGVAKKS